MSTTSYTSPGSSHFPLKEQKPLFSYLEPDQLGIYLTDSLLMKPVKSLSVILGYGKEIIQAEKSHNCAECDMKDCFIRGINQ